MEQSPLDSPDLRVIECHIDCGELDRAQRLLAKLKPRRRNQRASAYLVTRILFERGNLDAHEAASRLRSLLTF